MSVITDVEFEEIDENAQESAELDLSDDDSLPWLEADEDDENAGAVDKAQIIGFAVVLLALLLGVVGAIYLMTNRGGDADLVADGSTIEAPAGPIKERPEDPGGKEFAGTGNVAPAVGEGQTPEGQIASSDGTTGAGGKTTPIADADTPEQPQPKPSPSQAAAQPTGGAYVQLAAYGSRARAEQGWNDLSRQTGALSGKRYRVVEASVNGANVYRLQVVASDRASAGELCAAIKADGLDCAVK